MPDVAEQTAQVFFDKAQELGKPAWLGDEPQLAALDTQSGQMQEQQTHVLLEDGSALAETIYQPQIRGVAVLCDGGGDVRVAARITEMVGALLDLPSNRICVEQRKP